jgi:hypothetical protein
VPPSLPLGNTSVNGYREEIELSQRDELAPSQHAAEKLRTRFHFHLHGFAYKRKYYAKRARDRLPVRVRNRLVRSLL